MAASAQKALHDVIDHLTQSRDAFSAALAGLHDNARSKGSDMLESASALRDEALGSLTRASKTTRRTIETRPVESALLIAAVGIAIGWVWRRMQERETEPEQPATPPRRRSGTRSASSSR